MYKVQVLLSLLAVTNAVPVDHQATSFVSFNDNHNSVHHVQSAPAQPKYVASGSLHYAAPGPVKLGLPVAANNGIASAASYYSASPKYTSSPAHIAPQIAKYSAVPSYSEKEENYGPAQYEFAYIIEDPHTGDYHSQEEKRDGDHAVGQYSLHEADGTIRLVKYFDEGHGFNAVVQRQGHTNAAPLAYNKNAGPQYSPH